jgi:hypothetical protein
MTNIIALPRPGACFDPEAVAILSAALEDTWKKADQYDAEMPYGAFVNSLVRRAFSRQRMTMKRGLRDATLTAAEGGKIRCHGRLAKVSVKVSVAKRFA